MPSSGPVNTYMSARRDRIRQLVPVSKTEGGPFFGYADLVQIESGQLFVYDGEIPKEKVDTVGETAMRLAAVLGADDKPPPTPVRKRRARQHPAS